jgi:hypothetical protein
MSESIPALFNVINESLTSNDYYTPQWLFDVMGLEFDIDVAAPPHGIPWIPSKRWFSQADDGLAQDWGGSLVWMNPPFSNASPWVNKFINNGNGIALVPASRTKWFNQLWLKSDGVLATPTDFRFVRPDGKLQTIIIQTFLFAFGEISLKGINNVGRVR